MSVITKSTKESDIVRTWHLIDVEGQTLGRVATAVATLLMGKSKPYFVRHLDCGDYVVVVNAKGVKVTGKKEGQKKYYRYSGFPGGLSIETLEKLRTRKPTDIIIHAVKGMLPQNRLRDQMLERLHVYSNTKHPYGDKLKTQPIRQAQGENSNLKTTEEN